MYSNTGGKRRLEVSQKADTKQNSRSRGREVEKEKMDPQIEEISEIADKKLEDIIDFDDDDDDVLDEMARFVEGQDQDIEKDHSAMLEDDDKVNRRRAQRKKDLIENLKEDLRDPHQGMTNRQRREVQEQQQKDAMTQEEKARQRQRAKD